MTRIDPHKALQPLPATAGVEVTIPDSAGDQDKARAVLRLLAESGLRREYGFDVEAAVEPWAVTLGGFSFEVLAEAARAWIAAPDKEFPTLGQMETQARYVEGQHERVAQADEHAHTASGPCEECGWSDADGNWGNVHYVSVERGPGGEGRHMRPCPRCLPQKYHLYETGHWAPDHVAAGGCKQCRHYHWPWKFKDPRTSKGHVAA